MKGFFKRLFGAGESEDARAYGMTHPGMQRENNEDDFRVFSDRDIYIVADGMGGHNAGEVAAARAIELLDRYFTDDLVRLMKEDESTAKEHMEKAFVQASQSVYEMSKEDPSMEGMGCTLIMAFLPGSTLHVCHVGDVRCYVSRFSGLEQITNDHSYVWDLVRSGQLTREEARHHKMKNMITQTIGQPYPLRPECHDYDLKANERVLLCSDGLWDMLSDEEIQALLFAKMGVRERCEALIDQANAAGGYDNITVILFEGRKAASDMRVEKTLER